MGGTDDAGGSAQAEYERRRTRELEVQRSNRGRAPVIVALAGPVFYVLVVIAFHFINLWLSPQQIAHAFIPKGSTAPTGRRTNLLPIGLEQPIALVVAVMAALGLAVEFWGRRQSTEAWGTGAAGERATARILAPLHDSGFVVLHDRRMPSSRANIDHIVVGPTGVFTIESKSYSGVVRLSGGLLRRNGRRAEQIVTQAITQAGAVARALTAACNVEVMPQPVLCIHRASVERSLFQGSDVRGVRVCSGRRLVDTVRRGPSLLGPEEVKQLAALLDVAFPAVTVRSPPARRREPRVATDKPLECVCGGTLVLRRRRSDGHPFYGCTRYPKCRRTRSV